MFKEKVKKMSCMFLCSALVVTGGSFDMQNGSLTSQVFADEVGNNLLFNSTFGTSTDGWYATGGSLELMSDGNGHGSDGYVKVTGRTATWNSLAQNLTDKMENNTLYHFSCWVKLSDDYEDGCESDLSVGLTMKATGDNEGAESYDQWGLANNKVTASNREWRQISGTFRANWTGDLEKLEFKVADQNNNNSFYVDDLEVVADQQEISIQEDIPSLKEYYEEKGYDFKLGTALGADILKDENKMKLVEKHYNSVTAGNEMKPDYVLKGLNEDGSLKLDFTIPDTTLDTFAEYNAKQTREEDKIHIRGHVLCWHSQTPDWFFQDAEGNFLTKEAMNARLEEYIKAYVSHVQEKYGDLVYVWDVVNEAINPGDGVPGGLRATNSNYYKIYGDSNEYIINAFKYANKYVNPDVELFYNDYGETDATKMADICNLVDQIKAAEGTRIDGIGMQAHYSMESPSAAELDTAIRTYASHVDEVQITELDMLASKDYDGTEENKEAEQVKQAYRYKEWMDTITDAVDDGVNISAVVFWGVADDDSWLLSPSFSQGRHNMPLLFDEYLQAKPAYWALVDPDQLTPKIQEACVLNSEDTNWDVADSIAIGSDDSSTMKLLWKEGKLCVRVEVKDPTADAEDAVTLYLDKDNAKTEDTTGITETVKVLRSEATATAEGYVVEAELDVTGKKANDKVGFDVAVYNASAKTTQCWNDHQLKQAERSKYYGNLLLKPFLTIQKGSAVIDGTVDAIWNQVTAAELGVSSNSTLTTGGTVKTMWMEDGLYVLAQIKDSNLNKDNENAWEQDSFEIFVDENNGKTDSYEDDDCQYRINFENELSFNGTNCNAEHIQSATKITEDGYLVEAKILFNTETEAEGNRIGVDFQVNEADATGSRVGTVNWYDATGMGYAKPGVFGTALLGEEIKEAEPVKKDLSKAVVSGIKNYTYTGKAIIQKLHIKNGNSTLKENTDYTVTYKNNKNVGTATIIIEGCGDYTGTITKTFKIKKAAQKVVVRTASYTKVYGAKKFRLTGISAKGELTYKSADSKIATVDQKGYVTVKKYGKVTITVKAAGNSNYNSATAKITVKVVPAKLNVKTASKKAKQVTVSWKTDKTVTGYQVQYATKKNFSNGKKTTIKSAKTASTTLKKLTSKKNYYVRVRAYKKTTAGNVYGEWSNVRTVKVK